MADKESEQGYDNELSKIEPGMIIETTEGDVGEEDVSKPRVVDVIEDENGQPQKVLVKKGVFFQKEIEIPANRVQKVKQTADPNTPDKVVIATSTAETDLLTPTGTQELAGQPEQGPLDALERTVPTDDGMRDLEKNHQQTSKRPQSLPAKLLKLLGPGFLAGMAGNDSSAVTAYALDGAKSGYGHLWLMLLSTPLYQATQYASAKIGRLTQKGFAELLRECYGGWLAGVAAIVLIVANLALIAADLVAVGSALGLMTGLAWYWFVVPVALLLWYITVYQNFDVIKKVFLAMSLVFVTYLVTAVLSKPDWGQVLSNTFIPRLDFNFDSISTAVALLGATISPYSLVWQMQGEKEEEREGDTKEQLRWAAADIGMGVISGNLVAYAIMVCTAATLFVNHRDIKTAADAATSLEPLLGSAAKYLFGLGLIGSGLIAIPVLLASTSYMVAGTFGWPAGLSKKPWQSEGFYIILTVAIVAGAIVSLIGLDPIQLLFWANILNGVLAPVLVIFLLMLGNNRKIFPSKGRLSWLTNLGLVVTALIMIAGAVLLFWGMLTGQGQ